MGVASTSLTHVGACNLLQFALEVSIQELHCNLVQPNECVPQRYSRWPLRILECFIEDAVESGDWAYSRECQDFTFGIKAYFTDQVVQEAKQRKSALWEPCWKGPLDVKPPDCLELVVTDAEAKKDSESPNSIPRPQSSLEAESEKSNGQRFPT